MLLKMKHLAFAICLLGVSSGAIAKVSLVKSQNNVEEYQLDNGLRVILAPNDKQDRVYMNVVYFTGSLDDPKGKGGLAHLLEHLLFKGTQNIQGEEFQRRLDQHTLMTNAMTSFHYTQYINVMRAEQKNIDMLLEMEAERMDKSVIQMEHVPNEIEIVKREREIRLDQPFSVVQDQIFKELYGNQSLGRAPIGDLAELQSINLNELQQFYKTWYKPNNAALILSGKFDKQAVLAQVEKQFAHIPAAASFPDRAIHHIPTLDMAKLKNRQYTVKKGSQYSTFIGYMGGENKQIQDALSFADALFTTEPSGRLYQNLVKTKQATGVGGGARLENQYNFVLLGANFSPKHDHQQVEQTIIQQVEQGGKVSDEEVNRVRKTLQNLLKQTENDAVAFGSLLASYVAEQNDGSWTKYYQDLETLKTISAQEINGVYQQFFTPERRLVIDIEPTPEEQKQAQQQTQQAQTLKSLQEQKAEPLKDASVYLAEQQQLLQDARTAVAKIEPKIQRGQFKNGLKYAYYQTPMRDDKVYATITLGLGDVRALWGQNANLGLMAGQLIRASQQYNLQQIQDKSIDVNGGVSSIIPAKNNRMTITIHADKQHFADYFAFILQLIQNPAFDAEDYEVNRNKSLQALDRSYSEPATVAALTLQRMTEHYQPQDIRFSAEPEVSKAQLQASTRDDVVALYKKFFAMNHADIAISGEFDQAK
ncbi:MAG: insulinase family protein, partial [Acinetobacter sp.]|nr:insulinase family protein [Acinetobacter sp.]